MSTSMRSAVVPVGIDPDAWMEEHVDVGDFPGSNTVLLAFRVAGTREKEHYINYWAAMFTRKRGDVFPSGRMCHAELLLPASEGVYVKNSVTKKVYAGPGPDGKDTYKAGCVHCKLTHPSEWRSKYVFLSFEAKRKHILKALRFCILNNGMGFNQKGFNANLLVPGGYGVRSWDEALMRDRREYFCSEFIVTALKAMFSEDSRKEYPPHHYRSIVHAMNPATTCPNSVYRELKGALGVYDQVPLGRLLDV